MRERKKPEQSWVEKTRYELEHAEELLADRIAKVKELRGYFRNGNNHIELVTDL